MRSDRGLPKRPYLARYKYVFPKHRFFEWEEKDEWLARYMGVGREELQKFDSEWANPSLFSRGSSEVLLIGQPGNREDELRRVPDQMLCGYRPLEFMVAKQDGLYATTKNPWGEAHVRRQIVALHPRSLMFGDSRVIAFAPREMTQRRLMLSVVALLEELGFKMVVPASKHQSQMILPVEDFL